ncbi:hypothetical protein O6H91_04G003300 [Diphasiastrum complanatum]|uniref:Uncharacterized protein n=2 Tax=Diphasiastrum complanatum TaxID=34168 RepID=A0ACC2DTI8_DIPCM|nr:hypothetical protein O6H91_08G085300 [Diphasiastrum complanatum]KAJ7557639.1 hypothetical protein O6H91_04G003300 [Diphasiastrum complanatum]
MAGISATVAAECAKGIDKLYSAIAFLLWLGPFHLNIAFLILIPFGLLSSFTFPIVITLLTFLVFLAVIPIEYKSTVGTPVAKFICKYATKHFPIKVVADDVEALDSNRSYVVVLEPHSILPLGVLAFLEYSDLFPLKKVRVLVTSTALGTPVLRHIWTWMGAMPASGEAFRKLLCSGISGVIVPGGVQECLYMQRNREVVYLKKRFGFVRIAIQEGSPLVPVFVFGQTKIYDYVKPKGSKWYNQLSRIIGFAPLWMWGEYGTIIPYRRPMYVAVGKPIEVNQIEAPSREEIGGVHAIYLKALEELFERHKEAAGYKDTQLDIY